MDGCDRSKAEYFCVSCCTQSGCNKAGAATIWPSVSLLTSLAVLVLSLSTRGSLLHVNREITKWVRLTQKNNCLQISHSIYFYATKICSPCSHCKVHFLCIINCSEVPSPPIHGSHHRRNSGGRQNGGICPPQYFLYLRIFLWLLSWRGVNKNGVVESAYVYKGLVQTNLRSFSNLPPNIHGQFAMLLASYAWDPFD